MAKDRRSRDQKRKQKLAKRKQKNRPVNSLAYTGNKYRTDDLVRFLLQTEVGIYETYVMSDREIHDLTVVSALEKLIKQLRLGPLPDFEMKDAIDVVAGHEEDLVILNIRNRWELYFVDHHSPSREKIVGVLRTILGSIEIRRSRNRLSQSYLQYIERFLTRELGVSVEQVSSEEFRERTGISDPESLFIEEEERRITA